MLDLPEATAGHPPLQRARGRVDLSFRGSAGRTEISRLFQSGSARVRLPRTYDGAGRTAVLINTAGGLTGGDCMSAEILVGSGAHAVIAGQASEKVYRAVSGRARVTTRLVAEAECRLDWLPQETILFNGAALDRRLDIDLAPDAVLTAIEATVFGRAAMKETVRTGSFRDRWRIRRGGRLIFADDTRLDGPVAAILEKPAIAAGATAVATIVHAGPDAADRIGPLRAVLAEGARHGDAGASLVNGILVSRLLARSGQALRCLAEPALSVLRAGAPLPRVWSC